MKSYVIRNANLGRRQVSRAPQPRLEQAFDEQPGVIYAN
jgi:hypothetical protein